MNRAVLATAAALLFLVGNSTAASAESAAAPTAEAYGSGGTFLNITIDGGQVRAPASFSFRAEQRNGDPYQSTGYVRASPRNLDGIYEENGPTTCVDIRGNKFGLIYVNDETSQPPAVRGNYTYVTGIDRGLLGLDYTGIFPLLDDPGLGCPPIAALNLLGPVTDGDIIVRPAS